MRKLLLLTVLVLAPALAHAQATVEECVRATPTGPCQAVSNTNPLPVTPIVGASGGTGVAFGADNADQTPSATLNRQKVLAEQYYYNGAVWTRGGCTPAKALSAATTNATVIKASAGLLCSMTVINTTATVYYLKLYDKATAPTCNSDAVVGSYPVPASTDGNGYTLNLGPYGHSFVNGIGFCLTGALPDNDNTAAATGLALSYASK